MSFYPACGVNWFQPLSRSYQERPIIHKKSVSTFLWERKGELQDQFTDLNNDLSCQDVFEILPVTDFWLIMTLTYPEISKTALKSYCHSALHGYVNLPFRHFQMWNLSNGTDLTKIFAVLSLVNRVKIWKSFCESVGTSISLKSKRCLFLWYIFVQVVKSFMPIQSLQNIEKSLQHAVSHEPFLNKSMSQETQKFGKHWPMP